MDSIMTGELKMAPISANQSERSKQITIEAIGVCRTLLTEGSGYKHLTLILQVGGKNLPPDRSFHCHFRTAWN